MNKLLHKGLKNQKGFTLVELMVVVVIIGILIGIAVPSYNQVTASTEKKACEANMRTILGALQVYRVEHLGEPGYTDPTDVTELAGYFDETPTCPSDGTYSIGNTETDKGKVYCSEHNPSDGDGDEA